MKTLRITKELDELLKRTAVLCSTDETTIIRRTVRFIRNGGIVEHNAISETLYKAGSIVKNIRTGVWAEVSNDEFRAILAAWCLIEMAKPVRKAPALPVGIIAGAAPTSMEEAEAMRAAGVVAVVEGV